MRKNGPVIRLKVSEETFPVPRKLTEEERMADAVLDDLESKRLFRQELTDVRNSSNSCPRRSPYTRLSADGDDLPPRETREPSIPAAAARTQDTKLSRHIRFHKKRGQEGH